MAEPAPPRRGVENLADEIAALWRAVRELNTPTGTQQYNAITVLQAAVERLQTQQEQLATQQGQLAEQQAQLTAQQEQLTILVSDLDQRITDFINENIDAIVEAKVNEKLTGADVTIGQAGGVVRIPSIPNTDLTSASGRVVTWTAGDGRVGHT